MINYTHLRKLAHAAEPGPWHSQTDIPRLISNAGGYDLCAVARASGQATSQETAEFIAAANPATVLALLDELDAARRGQGRAHDAPPVAGRLHETHPIPNSRSDT